MKKLLNWSVWLFVAAPSIYLAMIWSKLPEIVPVHFSINGQPDRYGSKKEVLVFTILISGVALGIYLLCNNIWRIDPRRYASFNRERLQRIGFAVTVFLSGVTGLMVYSSLSGFAGLIINFILAATGLLFAIIGNYLPNLKPNYFVGIRVPWTLDNEENWRKTHALAGKLWFLGGLSIAVLCLLTSTTISFILFITGTLILVIVPCVFSYHLFKENKLHHPAK